MSIVVRMMGKMLVSGLLFSLVTLAAQVVVIGGDTSKLWPLDKSIVAAMFLIGVFVGSIPRSVKSHE